MADPNVPSTKKVALPVGIVGEDLRREEREIPAGEPPPWPPNAELKVIGKRTSRLEARSKVTGRARYTSDVQLRGMLHARRIVATVPHARIVRIDTSRAEQVPGVKAVHLLDRVVETPVLRNPAAEGSARWPTVRYVGQPIGAIAATTQAAAEQAVRLVEIEYAPLPFTVDLEEALLPGAPRVYPGPVAPRKPAPDQPLPDEEGNRRGPVVTARGDVAKGFSEAEVIVEATYRTQVQTHSPMETHAVVAHWDDGFLTLYDSTQATAVVRDDAADVLGLDPERVRVLAQHVGGGFGSKLWLRSHQVLAAHLSRKSGRPVRLALDRAEEHQSVGNRPSSRQRIKIGARRDGTLTALELDAVGSAGVGIGAGVSFVAERMYACPNFKGAQADVFTNAGPGAPFRAPGVPQGAFALEQTIDELAEKLGLDPLVLRDRIDVRDDAAADAHRVERRIGAERVGWKRRHAPGADPGPVKRGLGVAQSMWPHIVFPRASCDLSISRAGEVTIRSSVQDIGTGTRTVLAQVVAEELGLQPDRIQVLIGDTQFPVGPSSGGSNVTGSMTPVARNAAYDAGRALRVAAGKRLDADPERLVFRDAMLVEPASGKALRFAEAAGLLDRNGVTVRAQRTENYGYSGEGWRGAIGGVQFAEVAVDVETGVVRVERIVAVHDCGRPINPSGLENQIQGGIQHGLSYALLEERILDRATGRMVNPMHDAYKIAGSCEVPRIEIVLLEQHHGTSSTDARGIAEPANIATAAAIANAFYNATGVRLRELPMNPPRVLAALAAARRS